MTNRPDRADLEADAGARPPGLPAGRVPLFDPAGGQTVLEPEAPGAGYWVGAPSVLWDPARRSFLLTYRRRRPRGVHPDRGYVAHVAESPDGLRFTDIATLDKGFLGTTSMEKFCLTRPSGRPYRLYVRQGHRCPGGGDAPARPHPPAASPLALVVGAGPA
jgi:hypothetical protein